MNATTPAEIRNAAPRAGFGGVVRAELTKIRSVRSSYWTLLISVGLTIGIGLALLPTMIDLNEGAAGADPAAEGWWYEGLQVGIPKPSLPLGSHAGRVLIRA